MGKLQLPYGALIRRLHSRKSGTRPMNPVRSVFSRMAVALVPLTLAPTWASAGDFDMSGTLEPELRLFTQEPSNTRQTSSDASIAASFTAKCIWDGGSQSLIAMPFARLDQ